MKTFLFGVLLFIIGLFLCLTLTFAQQQEARMSLGVIGGGMPAAGDACVGTEYMGVTGTTGLTWLGLTWWWGNCNYIITAPCTGVVTELTAYVKSAGGTPGNCRLAIYDAVDPTSTKLCEGTAEVSVSSTSAGWVGHVGAGNITPNPCNVTKNTNYRLFISFDSDDANFSYVVGTDGDWNYNVQDYTGGFPSTINSAARSDAVVRIKAGIQ